MFVIHDSDTYRTCLCVEVYIYIYIMHTKQRNCALIYICIYIYTYVYIRFYIIFTTTANKKASIFKQQEIINNAQHNY